MWSGFTDRPWPIRVALITSDAHWGLVAVVAGRQTSPHAQPLGWHWPLVRTRVSQDNWVKLRISWRDGRWPDA